MHLVAAAGAKSQQQSSGCEFAYRWRLAYNDRSSHIRSKTQLGETPHMLPGHFWPRLVRFFVSTVFWKGRENG